MSRSVQSMGEAAAGRLLSFWKGVWSPERSRDVLDGDMLPEDDESLFVKVFPFVSIAIWVLVLFTYPAQVVPERDLQGVLGSMLYDLPEGETKQLAEVLERKRATFHPQPGDALLGRMIGTFEGRDIHLVYLQRAGSDVRIARDEIWVTSQHIDRFSIFAPEASPISVFALDEISAARHLCEQMDNAHMSFSPY